MADDVKNNEVVSADEFDRNDLIIQSMANNPLVKKEYKGMLKNITANLPAIKKSSSNFYKSHSQFMGVMLDVTAITPVRSVKHTLAELDKTRMALEEAHLKMKKKDIELRQKEHKLATDENLDEFDKELLDVEVLEIKVNMNNIQNSITGAVRTGNHHRPKANKRSKTQLFHIARSRTTLQQVKLFSNDIAS